MSYVSATEERDRRWSQTHGLRDWGGGKAQVVLSSISPFHCGALITPSSVSKQVVRSKTATVFGTTVELIERGLIS